MKAEDFPDIMKMYKAKGTGQENPVPVSF